MKADLIIKNAKIFTAGPTSLSHIKPCEVYFRGKR